MRVSVIVPNYNSGAILERCLQSLRNQNYEALEVILVDSLSADESQAVIDRNRDWLSRIICEKDKGQADGLNKGFRAATGEIFAWLCADDELMPGALDRVAAIFREQPEIDVVLGACERRFPDGSTVITPARDDAWRQIGIQNVIDQPHVLARFAAPETGRTGHQLPPGLRLGFLVPHARRAGPARWHAGIASLHRPN